MSDRHIILEKYDALRKASEIPASGEAIAGLLGEIYHECLSYLGGLSKVELNSQVKNKKYFAFKTKGKMSRAIHKGLYKPDIQGWDTLKVAVSERAVNRMQRAVLDKVLYSVAISFCAAIDLINKDDRQTPGTFFGKFVSYLFAAQLGVVPVSHIKLMDYDGATTTSLETDFVFDLGRGKQKFHVPVKTSSRERAIMFWAHQKLIDGAYGIERFIGTPVVLTETKTDSKRGEVVEVCLPDQWKVYQLYIARLKRIYYFDMPQAYAELNNTFPPICVKPFAEFFSEWKSLTPS